MAEQLYQLQTLERVCNPSSACTEREGSLGRSGRCHPTNIKCAFHQSLKIAVTVIARSDHLITLIAEEIGKPLRKKSIQWFIDSGKTIRCICWIEECLWALLATADASVYILPVLSLMDTSWSQESQFTSTAECSTTDVSSILLKVCIYTYNWTSSIIFDYHVDTFVLEMKSIDYMLVIQLLSVNN